MRYRELGSTGLEVSVIGFGGSPLGNVFGQVDTGTARDAVAAALDRGINLFDVSPYYGETLAEQRLGDALGARRAEVILATKCGRYGERAFDFSAATIIRSVEQSLQRLKTGYVDLFQAHDIEYADEAQILGETIPALLQLKQQGKVRFIGITGYWPGQLARVAAHGDVDCVLSYCHANLFADDIMDELAPLARRTGLGLLNASPLHMGLLGASPPSWHPAPEPVRNAALAVRNACRMHGVDAAVLATAVCLRFPVVASTLVGCSSVEEVAAACAAVDSPPGPALLQEVRALISAVHNVAWPSGLPENQDRSLHRAGAPYAAH